MADKIKSLVDLLLACWGWLVGAVGFGIAAIKVWRQFGGSLLSVIGFCHNLHTRYGDDAGKKIIEEIDRLTHRVGVNSVRLEMVEHRSSLALFVCLPTGACEFVNRELSELFGLDNDECRGFGWTAPIDFGDKIRVVEHWKKCVDNGLPYEERYTIWNGRTNAKLRIYARALPHFDSSGKLLVYVGTCEVVKE